MIYILDTNVFLRFLVRENEKDYRECIKLFRSIKSLKIRAIAPGIVLAEVGWVLNSYYNVSRAETARKIEGIMKLKGLEIVDDYDWLNAMKLYEIKNIKLVDAVLAAMPKVASMEWTVVSYDEDFKKLPVLWKKPKDIRV